MTEAQLVAAAKGGERAAFDVLCQIHAEKLFRTVSRITRNHHDAQDAVQDSLLSIFLHLKAFDGRSRFSTWVTRIAINSALMTLRKKHRCREVSLDSDDDMISKGAFTTEDPEKQFAERERQKLIRDEVAHLRATIRRPLELRELEDYSYNETAKMIGISIPAVKGRLFHARKALRKSNILRNQFGKKNTAVFQSFNRASSPLGAGAEAPLVESSGRRHEGIRGRAGRTRRVSSPRFPGDGPEYESSF